MRIVSLVPSATEMLFALGLGDEVIAVTHECDHPPAAASCRTSRATCSSRASRRPRSTPPCASARSAGEAIYALDERAAAELEPDLIVTQALCPVCAVSYDDVRASPRS